MFDFVTPYPDFNLPYLRDYAKQKGSENWFVGGTNGGAPRTSTFKPKKYKISRKVMTSKSKLSIPSVEGGGFAISLKAL